ncbi:carbohydrate ABC transporter permease [Micromonospora zhanjiangensis]
MTTMLSPTPGAGITTARPTRPRHIQQGLRERLAPYAYVAPFFLLFLIFGLFPLLFTFYVALFDWNPIGEHHFVGLDNFSQLMHDPRFWGALRNTFLIWVLSTVPQLLIALGTAHVLNHPGCGRPGFSGCRCSCPTSPPWRRRPSSSPSSSTATTACSTGSWSCWVSTTSTSRRRSGAATS